MRISFPLSAAQKTLVGVPSAGTSSVSGGLATLHPMRTGLARMVAVLRGVSAAVAVVAAVLGAVPPASWTWLGPALALVIAWTPLYVAVAWIRGLRPWLAGVDLSVAAALSLAVGHLVSAPSLTGTSNWVSLIASMTVVSTQLGGVPRVSVPAGLLVVACYVTGERLAGSTDGGLTALVVLTVQTLAGAAVMVVAMRAERTAVRAFYRLQEAQASAALARARREDERALLREVHNGPLTTLTMALHGAVRPTATLRRRAEAVLATLTALAPDGKTGGPTGVAGDTAGTAEGAAVAVADAGDGPRVRLDERLSQVAVWYAPPLRIMADLHPTLVPATVAEAMTGAVSEALENIVRYAATDRAAVELREDAGVVRVTVADDGRGFDLAALPGRGFGVREDLGGRMAAVGGTMTIRSAPGAGTVVALGWRRG
jgi:signal transduction histidine kinase